MQAAALDLAPADTPPIVATIKEAPLADPLDVLHRMGGTFYARLPGENLEVAASGLAWEIRAEGPFRFQTVRDAARKLFQALPMESRPPLRLWGGFSFADEIRSNAWANFGGGFWFLPAYQYVVQHGRAYEISVAAPFAPSPEVSARGGFLKESAAAWQATAAKALTSIAGGEFSKVVLARPRTVQQASPWQVANVLEGLRTSHPGAIFAFHRADDWFVSATPELLASVDHGRFATQAVAGTTRRGVSLDEDQQQARRLTRQ
jgi:isochorismate synthase EntC